MSTVTINVPQPQCRTLVNSSSRDELIIGHLSLVRSVAASVANSVPAHLDHGHSGIKGLIAAATRYQTDRDTNFASYAKHSHSRCYPLNSLRQADAASRKLRASYKKAQLTRDRLRFQTGNRPIWMASAMNLDLQHWRSLMINFRYLAASAPSRDEEQEQKHV